MKEFIVAFTNNTSNVLFKKRVYGELKKYVVVTDQLWQGDVFVRDFNDIDDAEKYAEEF